MVAQEISKVCHTHKKKKEEKLRRLFLLFLSMLAVFSRSMVVRIKKENTHTHTSYQTASGSKISVYMPFVSIQKNALLLNLVIAHGSWPKTKDNAATH